MFSYFEPNFIEKFLWESVFFFFFFQILAKIEMTQNKNWLFGRHFETVQYFQYFHFFFRIVNLFSPYIYGANFIAKIPVENGFLRLGP